MPPPRVWWSRALTPPLEPSRSHREYSDDEHLVRVVEIFDFKSDSVLPVRTIRSVRLRRAHLCEHCSHARNGLDQSLAQASRCSIRR